MSTSVSLCQDFHLFILHIFFVSKDLFLILLHSIFTGFRQPWLATLQTLIPDVQCALFSERQSQIIKIFTLQRRQARLREVFLCKHIFLKIIWKTKMLVKNYFPIDSLIRETVLLPHPRWLYHRCVSGCPAITASPFTRVCVCMLICVFNYKTLSELIQINTDIINS